MTRTEENTLLTIVKAQLVFLFSTLSEDNFDRNQAEIRLLSEQHGVETYLHFYRRLIAASQARLASTAAPSAFDTSTSLTFRLLVQETQRLARDPFLADRFRDSIDKGEGDLFRHFDLVRFADRIGLRPLERLVLASSIVVNTARKELAQQAANIIRVDFENAVMAICSHPSFDHADLAPAQIGQLLKNLLSEPPPDSPILDTNQRLALILASQQKYGTEIMGPILQQIFPSISLPPGSSLVQTLIQLGPDLTSDPETVRALLARFGISQQHPPRDEQVVEIISTLSRYAVEGAQLCDVGSVIRALSSFRVSLNWAGAIRAFDRPERHAIDTATLKLLIAILVNSPRDAEHHAVTGFWCNWQNSLYQLRLLDALLSLPSDTFNFVSLPGRRVVVVDDVASASPTIKALAANVQGHTWNSLDLFETLVRLGDAETMDVQLCVRDMLDKAVKISAELVHMGLLQVPKPWNSTQYEYASKLLAMFLAGHPNHQLVFMRIWQIDPNYLTSAFREFYDDNALNITRILDVAQDLKILDSLLDVRPFTFALDVAALASRREYLNLDKWLADNINTHGEAFIRSLMDFLDMKIKHDQARVLDSQLDQRTMSLNPQTIATFIRVMRNYTNSPAGQTLPQSEQEYMVEIRNACLQLHPRLMNLAPGSDQEPGMSVVTFPSEVEAEVEGIYQKMYAEAITIDQVLGLLQRAKTSTNPRDHEIFACTLHTLFDEYKFFPSDYPARELLMTGYLFGSLIQYQLVDYIPLGIAIRYVLDALKEPPESNMFKFGVQALSRFVSRLPEWQPLCQALLAIPHLQDARPDLAESARRALLQAGESVGINGNDVGPGHHIPLPFTALQPDQLEDEDFQVPEEEVSDKVLFIINNLAPNNFESKTNEMKDRFSEAHSRWLANYLVDQRVSTEPNNHSLYLRFLDALNRPVLNKYVLHETYIKSGTLLNSDLTLQSSSERTILKNLGSWLGAVTLARSKPIKHRNLSVKDLLLEGYDNNRLIVAIPFICKILEQCANSKAFKPPNPWLMAVISLLAELYHFADLRLNLKFEIEVLCKSLELDLDKVEPTTVLRERPAAEPPLGLAGGPHLPDYAPDIDAIPITASFDQVGFGDHQQHVMPLGTSPTEPRITSLQIEAILNNLANNVVISPQLAPLHTNHAFKRAVTIAVDRTVREIILPVVERSVTIAGISTRELVAKDFALEGNEEKMRRAAHQMVQKLAGSLALVTCKEPLKSNMATHIRPLLAEHGFTERMVHEPAIQLLVQDNLEVACSAIETAAMERAVAEVDDSFAQAYEARRRHREQRSGLLYWEPGHTMSNFAANLPDHLRIRPTGLSFVQTKVYDEFALEMKRKALSRPGSTVAFGRNDPSGQFTLTPDPQEQVGPIYLNMTQCLERFAQIALELERIIGQVQATIQTVATLPPNHDLRHFINQILHIPSQSLEREETALAMSQRVVQFLYNSRSDLGREIYVILLDRLCDSSPKVGREAVDWLLFAEDERKLNVPVTVALLRGGVVSFHDEDQQLAKIIERDLQPSFIDFVASLIRECIFGDHPCANRSQFLYSIEALTKAAHKGVFTDTSNRVLEELQAARRPSQVSRSDADADAVYERLRAYFGEWVVLFRGAPASDKAFYTFVTQLASQGILKGEEISSLFFRVCMETSVEQYIKHTQAGQFANAFQAVDAFSRLIVMLVKFHGEKTAVNNDAAKVHYLTKVLSIIILVLAYYHEHRATDFQPKPFFRFFSSLLSDLHSIQNNLGTAYIPLLNTISETFLTLQPTYFPGFAFSWMSLISHRLFMPKLLLSTNREGWPTFHRLIIALFKFLSFFLQTADLKSPVRNLFRGSLRLLLVLLHDFPDFLSEHYFTICDVIPFRCIQLRNVVLSAFPNNITLPDPHMRNIKWDSLPEMGPIPPVLSDFTANLTNNDLRGSLDQYLLGRGSQSFLTSLKDRLTSPEASNVVGDRYNTSVINALVMYVGVSSVAQAKARSGSPVFVSTDPGVVMLQYLASTLDVEGQHHLLSSIVMHLRYPNAHTHWFSSLVLFLFHELKGEPFREIVTKVLLERFIVHRPHPWGALITFIELLRNPRYEFWRHDFTHSAPEITMLLENIPI